MARSGLNRFVSIIAIIAALGVAGCRTTGGSDSPSAQAASRAPQQDLTPLPPGPLAEDALSQATYWGARYEEDPANAEMAVRFSSALRDLGSYDQATVLMGRTAGEHPHDADVMAEYARVMVETQRGEQALAPLAVAISQRPGEWQLHSLQGVAYDQMSDFANATQSYERALSISPRNPKVLNNYGLSRALAGDLDGAEHMLRAAADQPGASAQVRQNLALVLGLQGNFEEAERMSRSDLPPELVANNVAYYRAILTQPSAWADMTTETSGE